MSRINVIGLGYIGLPTALMFARHGYDVQGVDVSEKVRETLKAGKVPFDEAGFPELLSEVIAAGRFHVTEHVQPADIHILCVPSPVRHDTRTADVSYIESATRSILPVLEDGDLVILESTVPPGTTQGVVDRLIREDRGERHGVLVAHCPETVIPGNMLHELVHNSRVIGGLTSAASEAAVRLYRSFVQGPIHSTDATTAEFVKVAQNTYRDVNIALANELASLCRSLGVDAREAIRIANQHPRVDIHQPGPGVGGHCIPVDPWFLVSLDVPTPLIETARAINDARPVQIADAIVARTKDVPDPKVAVLGAAYKPDVDDARESPAEALVERLHKVAPGLTVASHDPHVKQWAHPLSSLEEALEGASVVVVMTGHKEYAALGPRIEALGATLIDATGIVAPRPPNVVEV